MTVLIGAFEHRERQSAFLKRNRPHWRQFYVVRHQLNRYQECRRIASELGSKVQEQPATMVRATHREIKQLLQLCQAREWEAQRRRELQLLDLDEVKHTNTRDHIVTFIGLKRQWIGLELLDEDGVVLIAFND